MSFTMRRRSHNFGTFSATLKFNLLGCAFSSTHFLPLTGIQDGVESVQMCPKNLVSLRWCPECQKWNEFLRWRICNCFETVGDDTLTLPPLVLLWLSYLIPTVAQHHNSGLLSHSGKPQITGWMKTEATLYWRNIHNKNCTCRLQPAV